MTRLAFVILAAATLAAPALAQTYRAPTPAERAVIEAATRPPAAPQPSRQVYNAPPPDPAAWRQRDETIMAAQRGDILITERIAGKERVVALTRDQFADFVAELVVTGELAPDEVNVFVRYARQESARTFADLTNQRADDNRRLDALPSAADAPPMNGGPPGQGAAAMTVIHRGR